MPKKRKSENSKQAAAKLAKKLLNQKDDETKNSNIVEKIEQETKTEKNNKEEIKKTDEIEIVANYDDLFPEPFQNSFELDKSVAQPQAKELKKVPKNTKKLSLWNLDSSEALHLPEALTHLKVRVRLDADALNYLPPTIKVLNLSFITDNMDLSLPNLAGKFDKLQDLSICEGNIPSRVNKETKKMESIFSYTPHLRNLMIVDHFDQPQELSNLKELKNLVILCNKSRNMKDAKTSISSHGMDSLPVSLESIEFDGLIGYCDFLKNIPKNIRLLKLQGEFDVSCIKEFGHIEVLVLVMLMNKFPEETFELCKNFPSVVFEGSTRFYANGEFENLMRKYFPNHKIQEVQRESSQFAFIARKK